MESKSTHRKKSQKFYQSKTWRSIRAIKLMENPLCEECERNGLLTPAYAVDHITPLIEAPDLALDYENLQSLCLAHHSQKTARENLENMKTKPPIDPMAESLKHLLK